MDLAYLTGQRPADVLVMRRDDIEGVALGVKQQKTHKKLRILLEIEEVATGLGVLVNSILALNERHSSPYLILTETGKRVTAAMLRHRWDDAREKAVKAAEENGDTLLAGRISQFQFRDIRPKAASEIKDIEDASLLLGHTKGDITERVYRRVGAIANLKGTISELEARIKSYTGLAVTKLDYEQLNKAAETLQLAQRTWETARGTEPWCVRAHNERLSIQALAQRIHEQLRITPANSTKVGELA